MSILIWGVIFHQLDSNFHSADSVGMVHQNGMIYFDSFRLMDICFVTSSNKGAKWLFGPLVAHTIQSMEEYIFHKRKSKMKCDISKFISIKFKP